MRSRRVYDSFLFSGEHDVLALRLNELQGVVDRFVVIADTFDLLRYKGWPIEHVSVESVVSADPGQRERHRDRVARTLMDGKPGDVILVGDVNEIPRREVVAALRDIRTPRVLQMRAGQTVLDWGPLLSPLMDGTRAWNVVSLRSSSASALRWCGGIPIPDAGWVIKGAGE